ncbi:MAG: DUF4159 domain-containing protein [Candidatus Firestonebacteria bacterium]
MRFLIIIILIISCNLSFASKDNFFFIQLKYNGGNYDPNPGSWPEIYDFIITTTNIHSAKERKEITLNNDEIFNYPFLVITGDSEFNKFSDRDIETLKRFFDGGGICFIDDTSGIKDFGFDKAIKREFLRVIPNSNFERIKDNHAIFYAFYLIPQVVGAKVSVPYLEGIEYNNQMAVIYSHNDLLGIWAKDKLGNFLKDCIPYGEKQRFEGMKLTVNILMYALTGTYKLDAIHLQYIQRKIEEMRMLKQEKK